MRITVLLMLAALLVLSAPAATAQATTQPGLFFTIANGCGSAVSGFAVGDELCLLQIGSATFTRAIFQGTLVAGAKKSGMACAGKDGNGKVIFVPPVQSGAQAVVMDVKPDQVVSIPQTFCGGEAEAAQNQLKKKP